MQKSSSYTSVIKNKGFLNLWINQILVQLSYNSLNFALIMWVYQLTDSNTAVAALLFAVYLPAVIFGLFAGVLVDITDRKKIIMAINLCMAGLFFSLIFLKESYFSVLAVAFLINTMSQFYAPSEASAIPLIVKKSELWTANSLFTITMFSSFIVGFALAGPLINHFGINFVFGIGGGLLLTAFILALKFPSIINKFDEEGRALLKAIRKRDLDTIGQIGLLEIRKTLEIIKGKFPVFFSILIMAGIQIVVGVLAVIVPAFLEREVGIHKEDASYILILPLAFGILCGGFLIGKFGTKIPRRVIVGRGILTGGLLFFLLGIAPLISPVVKYFPKHRPLPFFYQPSLSTILILGSFLLGIAMVAMIVPSQTVLQENTPEEKRAKVFSVLGVATQGLSLIPVLLAGVFADFFGSLPIFMGMGGIVALFGLFALKPDFYFEKKALPYRLREFLGLGHWER